MTKVHLYHRKKGGQIKEWRCWVSGISIHSEWGQQGGEMNHTVEIAHRIQNRSAKEVAQEIFEKKVAKRMKRGYVATQTDVVDRVQVNDTTLNFDQLPKSFAPAKPIKKPNPDELAKWDVEGKLFIQRKRDGMRHYLVSDTQGCLRIYSSGKDDMTDHLQPLLNGLTLPPKTILDCELVVTEPDKHERDGFLIVSGIARSLALRARDQIRLAQGMGARVQLFAFDLLWESGTPVYKYRYEDRYQRLAKVIEKATKLQSLPERYVPGLVRMPLVPSRSGLATLREALDLVERHKWEGLVVWRKDQATVVQVNGSPCRVNCWKVKPVQEEDVVATGFDYGKGKNSRVVGAFNIGMYRKRKLVSMGNCGTGLDDQTRQEAVDWTYPCVIQIEYDQKSEKGFRFPVFIRRRTDKKPIECVTE